MSFISRCRLDIRMPTAWERFPSSSLIIWGERKKPNKPQNNLHYKVWRELGVGGFKYEIWVIEK